MSLLVIGIIALLFSLIPLHGEAAESEAISGGDVQFAINDVNYVCVQFKDFPFLLLWQLKDMAEAIKKEIPAGLTVGKDKKNDQGYLLVSYEQKGEGILLSMNFHRLSTDASLSGSKALQPMLSMQCQLDNPTSGMVADKLRALFASFIATWEKGRIPAETEEIALFRNELHQPS